MNISDTSTRQAVDQLIQDLEDGVITAEDRVTLMELMRQHASVRDLYLQHIELTALLHETAENRAALGTMPVNEQILQQAKRKNALISLTYGIAAMLIIGLVLMLFQVSHRLGLDGEGIVLETSDNAAYSVNPSEDEPRSDKKLRVGDRVTINQGMVRFTFPSGVKAIVEGPSQIALTSDLSVKVDGGQAWFRVPEAGHGFTVQTKQVDVIDLGTEFGVRFGGEGKLEVHVAKGIVKIDPTTRGLKDVELIKGEAMTFDEYGRGSPIKAMASLFQTKFTTGIPYLHWSFDQIDNGNFLAEGTISGASGYQAELQNLNKKPAQSNGQMSSADCQTDGPFGKAFSMKGNGLFAQTSFPGISGQIPRTVVAWVRHRVGHGYSERASYCRWGNPTAGQIWEVSMSRQNDLTLSTSSGRSHCGTPIHSSHLPDRWLHVASVYTGITTADGYPEILHYINGELQQSTQAYSWPEKKSKPLVMNTDISSDAATPLRIGAANANGDLDELYLFRGALSEPQIQQLMETNRVESLTR